MIKNGLAGLSLSVVLLILIFSEAPASGAWYRGNLHCHSQWSDGQPMPEWAVAWYKDQGYHFLCLSDHNTFQSEELRFDAWCGGTKAPENTELLKGKTSRWKEVVPRNAWGVLSQSSIDQTVQKFGTDSLQSFVDGERTLYRLKTFDELVQQFAEPGKFLLIPGFEQTGSAKNNLAVHMNFINVRTFFPYIAGKTPDDVLSQTFAQGKKVFSDNKEPYLFTLNHPRWPLYDLEPQLLIDHPEVHFFELNNNTFSSAYLKDLPKAGWVPEQFWDVVNSHRAAKGETLLYAFGSDDNHGYVKKPARGWSVVRSDKLEFPALYDAFVRGDFYASSGLDFEDIQFNPTTGTLAVKVKPVKGQSYRIDFIGTKKGFDPVFTYVNSPKIDRTPARKIPQWSNKIGVVLSSVHGTGASYTLADDDLFVRARIVLLPENKVGKDGLVNPGAWSQPYTKTR